MLKLLRIRRTRSLARRIISNRNFRMYWLYRLLGRPYRDFYANRMNHIALTIPDEATGKSEDKMWQLEYLKDHGLQPHHVLLDYGCGTAAAGIHMIKYLNSGNYYGTDISGECIRLAGIRLSEAHLWTDKKPHLYQLPPNNLLPKNLDYIWMQSVLTHMPLKDIDSLLKYMACLIKPSGKLYATFGHASNKPQQLNLSHIDFYYTDSQLENVANKHGWTFKVMQDFQHPAGKSLMIEMELKRND